MYGRNYNYSKPRVEYTGPREATIMSSIKEGWVKVSMPYDKACIDDLKAFIESGGRRWNPDTKFWEVKEIYLGTLVKILQKHFGANVSQSLTSTEEVSGNIFKPLFAVLKDMPNNEMKRVYNALAFALHPDRGGSNEQMVLLNQAYDSATEDKK